MPPHGQSVIGHFHSMEVIGLVQLQLLLLCLTATNGSSLKAHQTSGTNAEAHRGAAHPNRMITIIKKLDGCNGSPTLKTATDRRDHSQTCNDTSKLAVFGEGFSFWAL
eukprot:2216165-Amphidinium_carterae.1